MKGAVRFFLAQTKKTLCNPTRIFIIPLRILHLHVISRIPQNSRIITYFTKFILSKEELKAQLAIGYSIQGHALLEQDEPEAAWAAFKKCLQFSSNPDHFLVAGLCLIIGLGQYKNGVSIFSRANALRRAKAIAHGLTESRIRYLDQIWGGSSFGHIAEIDYVVKLGILEGRVPDETVLYIPPGTDIANRFLLEQWRPHLRLLERTVDLPMPLDRLKAVCFDFRGPLLADGSTAHYWKVAADVYRRWHTQKRKPLLTLPMDIFQRGQSVLRRIGISNDDWFVTLHVREAASKNYHNSLHAALNAKIADYLPTIEEITSRGGWVIRIGDPAMTPLPSMPNVLDYCHSNIRSDWMDIYFLAAARFFVGTSSGPAYAPPLYGVPCVLTNWWPPAQRPWHPQDIFIPKLYRWTANTELLSLSSSLAEPFGHCNSVRYLKEKHGVTVDDNSPNDILAAVREMLDRLDGQSHYDSEEDVDLQKLSDQIYSLNNSHGMASISREFLRKYSSSFLK